ncbi:lysR substrate binding domain protein [Candidatus Erwinia dacicola]|uniref:LysR substrate binding domain protein n=1 Tax=Candidatus Erwinia dacicola TaxID=252393 RepID=A0A328TW10_9GAMM|nr:lysR substrate binding domain protein [Candidatus Erwinia dacicola]
MRFEDWFRAAGVQPGNVMEIQSYHAMLACMTSGGGLALLPAAALEQMPGCECVRQHPIPAELRDTDT